MFITAGMTLHTCLPALLMRPTKQNVDLEQTESRQMKKYIASGNHPNKSSSELLHKVYLIFSDWKCVLFCIVYFLQHFIVCITMSHIVAFAESTGISQRWSSLMIMTIGLANLGRWFFHHVNRAMTKLPTKDIIAKQQIMNEIRMRCSFDYIIYPSVPDRFKVF